LINSFFEIICTQVCAKFKEMLPGNYNVIIKN
jgi:hypothetical protein